MAHRTDIENVYKDGIDFAALAAADKDFAQVYQDGKLDLQDPRSLQQLTKSLLKRDFKVDISLPDDRLCPPVPIRHAYILFLTSLLASACPLPHAVTGLDIGTGASLIYPLLGTALHSDWTFHATDIDAHSLTFARHNAALNPSLSGRIHIHTTASSSPLLALDALAIPSLDFAMCNPPFYASAADMRAAAAGKAAPPSAICTGGDAEMICPGGDAGFALRMVAESVVLRARVRWCSVMLGRLGSVYAVVAAIKEAGCGNWAVGVLGPGRRTRRWVVAWSWTAERLGMEFVRSEEVAQGLWGAPTVQSVWVEGRDEGWVRERLGDVLGALDVKWSWDEGSSCGTVEARGNTWSRSARRKKARVENDMDAETSTTVAKEADEEMALTVRITPQRESLEIRWLRGLDAVLFESFCGMLKRAMRPG